MKYGYGRVSDTTRYAGGEDGNSLEAQEKKLREAGCEEIILEAYTGTKMDRPKFSKLIKKLKSGDTLVVCKLDRFARTARDSIGLIRDLVDEGVAVHVLNMGLIEDTPVGRLMLTVMIGVVEFERDTIVERMADGKNRAKEKNPDYREGRKPFEKPDNYEEVVIAVESGDMTVVTACAELGISRSLWYKWLKEAA